MPEIARFYGIVIRMFTRDHQPPHFHAVYAEWEACISIAGGEVTEGRLPNRALRLVRDWHALHREELTLNWDRGQAGNAMEQIEGLDANQGD